MSVTLFLVLLGGVITLGFFGNYLFRITKIPNPVILMAAGIILGPLTGFLTSDAFMSSAPYFGTVALILIMFEGGLDLEFEVALSQFNTALFLGLIYFVIAAGGIAALALLMLQIDVLPALLYGSVLAGTSPAVIFPVINKLSISKNLRTLLSLETAFTEVLTVVSVIILLDISAEPQTANATTVLTKLGSALGISLLLAAMAGLIWSRFMGIFSRENLAYMLTLGVVFLLYAFSEFAGGKAAITILFFGLLLGNGKWLASKSIPFLNKMVKTELHESHFELDEVVKKINAELSFLIRTFFFVFMGLLFDFSVFNFQTILFTLIIIGIMLLGRLGSLQIILPFSTSLKGNHISASLGMLPRGLACAVMAFLVLKSEIPGTEAIVPVAFGTILLSNLMMTGFVFYFENKHAQSSDQTESENGSPQEVNESEV
jgi:cell volume regulation protein A